MNEIIISGRIFWAWFIGLETHENDNFDPFVPVNDNSALAGL